MPLPPRNYDKDVLLKWFFYRITAEERAALMREHPEAYNRYVGQDVARVCIDGHEIKAG